MFPRLRFFVSYLLFFCCWRCSAGGVTLQTNDGTYEVTRPQWLQLPRVQRSAGEQHPSRVEVAIRAGGEQLVLDLHKNVGLFSPGYQEVWFSPTGGRHASTRAAGDHCFYHGAVQNIDGSSVAVSSCSGLRGVIVLNSSVSFFIEPLDNQTEPGGHAVFNTQDLNLCHSCSRHHDNENHRRLLRDFIGGMAHTHWGMRERRDISRNMKYVELMIVADYAEFVNQGRDLHRTRMKLLEAANLVDKFYRTLRIRVALIGLEIWSDRDKIPVSENPYSTLGAFLHWRQTELRRLPNDNAQLITGLRFQASTIGLAPLRAMCSEYQSGGVNSDHSEVAVGVAATVAHEMGHNFGMNHDSESCCQADPADGGCIMAAATGHPFPRVFNSCNQRELQRYLDSGGGKCLFNSPNTRMMVEGRRCGNGYLEEGEECDCGEEEECSSPCCNAGNCTLKAGAECAHGICCHDCKLKAPGDLCRPPVGPCDLPEYCDGKSEACPANFYLLDGARCAGGGAYCYTGMCLSLESQCVLLWGRDARPAPDVCFTEVNQAGNLYGNCGKDLMGNYRACSPRDAMCGKIQCVTSATSPIETNAVAIDTTVRINTRSILCKGTHVYQPVILQGDGAEAGPGDTLDPGLVLTGTKCAENGVCFEGECRNASFLQENECSSKCHGHGRCNNNHNCHCEAGWAPPYCHTGGSGGSEDSGPVIHTYNLLPVILLLLLFLGIMGLGFWWFYKHKLHLLKRPANHGPDVNPSGSSSVTHGHSNPTYQLKSAEPDRSEQARQHSSPAHSIIRPAVKPPPIPVYASSGNMQTSQPAHKPQIEQPHLLKTRPQHPATPQFRAPAQAPPLSLYTPPSSAPLKYRPPPPSRPPPPCPSPKPAQDV
ncbi:disintegrin and metalloproteinase domain-containing protein 19-like isoform X2 [Denticeps clupeoides]|uniref:disintegrin and metalloproteinase domain-containing protein 19-like isoform X2 n=1 Tax=Denticeps clupeoides TaxID=299321 RepID=UPI0010A4C0FB|nr:disintegrin and metalloproteinase domain-containing protein 19-like isoform X2 [Denticeps clupeoides]